MLRFESQLPVTPAVLVVVVPRGVDRAPLEVIWPLKPPLSWAWDPPWEMPPPLGRSCTKPHSAGAAAGGGRGLRQGLSWDPK